MTAPAAPVDWSQPIVTHLGTPARVVDLDDFGYRVEGDFGTKFGERAYWFDPSGESSFNLPISVRNATPLPSATPSALDTLRAEVVRLREAGRNIAPYLKWTISDESPGHHPTMPSAVAAFLAALAESRADAEVPKMTGKHVKAAQSGAWALEKVADGRGINYGTGTDAAMREAFFTATQELRNEAARLAEVAAFLRSHTDEQ